MGSVCQRWELKSHLPSPTWSINHKPFPSVSEYNKSSLFYIIYMLGEQGQLCEDVMWQTKGSRIMKCQLTVGGRFCGVGVCLLNPELLSKHRLTAGFPGQEEGTGHPVIVYPQGYLCQEHWKDTAPAMLTVSSWHQLLPSWDPMSRDTLHKNCSSWE